MTLQRCRVLTVLAMAACAGVASSQITTDINLQPKYGAGPKSEMQRDADRRLLRSVDEQLGGDRPKAAAMAAQRGWEAFLRQDMEEAMRRFNQAWLLDGSNAMALWGMGAVMSMRGDAAAALPLFAEVEPALRDDVDFQVDHALALAKAATGAKDPARIAAALARFGELHAKAPDHTLNLQNWALTLAVLGRYDEAWQKVQLALATPRRGEVNPQFVADLRRQLAKEQAAQGSARNAAVPAPSPVPELWSDHKLLTVSADACAQRGFEVLSDLKLHDIRRNGLFTYANQGENRAAVKCVAIGTASLVYFAVAGGNRQAVENLRNRIAWAW